eukprot:scaffold126698_cov75-Phaeocystis_antarctica.AAC.2
MRPPIEPRCAPRAAVPRHRCWHRLDLRLECAYMLRVDAVLDLVRITHLGERFQVVEPLAQDDVDQIVNEM